MRMTIRHPQVWFGVSLVTIALGLIIIFGLRPTWGIDFVGGSLLEVPAESGSSAAIRQVLKDGFNLSSTIQPTGDGTLLVRTEVIDGATHQGILTRLSEAGLTSGEELRFETIGPTIGKELRRRSLVAIALALAAIILYLAYTFRGIKGLVAPWQLGLAAVYALLHDLVVVTAVFVILGMIWQAPVDTLFVTALLAILGYSVNDTIVLFDRMKTEWLKNRSMGLWEVLHIAFDKSLTRTLNTSLTTALVLVTLLIWGGSTIRWFVVALLIGAISGTYSSLFVAAPFLYKLSGQSDDDNSA